MYVGEAIGAENGKDGLRRSVGVGGGKGGLVVYEVMEKLGRETGLVCM